MSNSCHVNPQREEFFGPKQVSVSVLLSSNKVVDFQEFCYLSIGWRKMAPTRGRESGQEMLDAHLPPVDQTEDARDYFTSRDTGMPVKSSPPSICHI